MFKRRIQLRYLAFTIPCTILLVFFTGSFDISLVVPFDVEMPLTLRTGGFPYAFREVRSLIDAAFVRYHWSWYWLDVAICWPFLHVGTMLFAWLADREAWREEAG